MGERRRATPAPEAAETIPTPDLPASPPLSPEAALLGQLTARLAALEEQVAGAIAHPLRRVSPADLGLADMLRALKHGGRETRRAWQGCYGWAQRTQGGTRGPLTDWLGTL